MKRAEKMTPDEMKKFMEALKRQLREGEIDRAEFERRRAPLRAAIERRMFT